MVILLLLAMPTLAQGGGGAPATARTGSVAGPVLPRHVSPPDPFSFQLPYDYYEFFSWPNPYANSIQLNFQVTASVSLDVYVMNQTQFLSFRASGSKSSVYHNSGANTAGTASLSGSSTSYLVIDNDLVRATATVEVTASTVPVDVLGGYSSSPAPVGIADYGVEEYTGATLPYEIIANGVVGNAKINSLGALNSTAPSPINPDGASLQLNIVLGVNTTKGQYAYWLQDVATFRTSVKSVYFQSEIFNFSLYNANLTRSLVSGKGQVYPLPGQAPQPTNTYIYDTSVFSYQLPYYVELLVSYTQSANSVAIKYGYLITENGVPVQGSAVYYDTVTITESAPVSASGIVVDGYKLAPDGHFYDAELVFGGEFNSERTTFTSMDAALSLSYQMASGTLVLPRSLFEFGGDTGEAAYNLQTTFTNGNFEVSLGTTSFTKNYLLPGGVIIPLTFSFSVAGGATPPGPPTLTYLYGGVKQTVALTSMPTVYYVDNNTAWSVSPTLTSTSSERWAISGATSGTVLTPQTLSFVYYHQYSVGASSTIAGGGSPGASLLTYTGFGSSQSLQLSATLQSVWADAGTQYSATNPLSGSGTTERWFATGTNGTVSSALTLTLTYNHQYSLTSVSTTTTTTWQNAGAQVQDNVQEVYGRANGTGYRITSAVLDGGTPQTFPLTTGTVTFSFTMNGPHTLTFTTVEQYEVLLQGGSAAAVNSITPTTISGDPYWYDSGTQVSLTLNGVYGRGSGTGTRVSAYQLNGSPGVPESTTGTILVLSGLSLSSPQTVTISTTTQNQLTDNDPQNSEATITPPAIPGDTGWYNSGTSVTIALNNVKDATALQRNNLLSYTVDGKVTTLSRSGAGTVSNVLVMSAPHTVSATYQLQYPLTVSGGGDVVTSPASPTQDSWFDPGTTVTVSASGVYGRSAGSGTRVTAWTVDSGSSTAVATAGTVTVSSITMNSGHTVTFLTTKQYQMSISSGCNSPQVTAPTIPNDTYWYDSGTSVSVSCNGSWSRANGSGTRATGYVLDGGSTTSVATAGRFTLANLVMNSPRTLDVQTTTQYLLTTPSGFLLSVTNPPISGDTGWYDSGTQVQARYNDTWNEAAQATRSVATSYSVDNGTVVPVISTSNGVFPVEVLMNAPHTIGVSSTTQYFLSVLSPYGNPTGQGWYNAGSAANVTVQSPFQPTSGTRYLFQSFTGTGAAPQSGNSTSVMFKVSSPSSITISWKTQYLVSVVSGGGTVTGGGWYDVGTVANVSATSPSNVVTNSSRLVFEKWVGTTNSTSTTIQPIVGQAYNLTAVWVQQYYVSASTPIGSVSGTGWYAKGSTATVQVTPTSKGFLVQQVFRGWAEGTKEQGGVSTLTVNGPVSLQGVWGTDYTQLIILIIAVGAVGVGGGFFQMRRSRGAAGKEEFVGKRAKPPAEPPAQPPAQAAKQETAQETVGTVRCPACGAENPASDAYCGNCGASLKKQ